MVQGVNIEAGEHAASGPMLGGSARCLRRVDREMDQSQFGREMHRPFAVVLIFQVNAERSVEGCSCLRLGREEHQ
jgi:hypothetical protein